MARFADAGDTVTMVADWMVYFTTGRDYVVIEATDDYFDVRDDENDTYTVYSGEYKNFKVKASNAELQELRAFKAAALARFPALAEPETDDEAIARFTEALDSGCTAWTYILREAFAWARANPR